METTKETGKTCKYHKIQATKYIGINFTSQNKSDLDFFQLVHVLQRRNNGSVGKTVVPLARNFP